MTACDFVFDLIVTHLESNVVQIKDPAKLQVNANFGGIRVPMTASRINVTEFKSGAGVEMKMPPKKLRKNLLECGMAMTVAYNSKVIGDCQLRLPEDRIDEIREGMSDLMQVQGGSFEKDGEVIGKLEVLFRLVIKCDEKQNEGEPCVNMDKSIAKQDILFIMAESQRCANRCENCLDVLETEEGDDRLQLDLQRYRSSTAGGSRAADIFTHNPVANSACCKLKKMAQDCEAMIDEINKEVGHPKPLKSPCRRQENQDGGPCPNAISYVDIQPSELKGPCFSYIPARRGEGPDFCDPALNPVPISDLEKPSIKDSRFCPICLTNMSWLPKFATCPKCGVKPMPMLEERHKEAKLTPEQIIQEFVGKSADHTNDCNMDPCDTSKIMEQEEEGTQCRCTCKFGKLCAHCRIRKLCADIFQASKNVKACPIVKPQSSEDFCVLKKNENECRPYLAQVFSELRDLYNVKDSISQPQQAIECAKWSSKKRFTAKKNLELKPVKQKHRKVGKALKLSKRNSAGFHKHCAQRKGAVPRNHGWAWGVGEEASKNGWRPGSVRKSVKRLMRFFLHYSPANSAINKCKEAKAADDEKSGLPPTLHVSKKNGEISVTLRALNRPNIHMKPIVFNLVKSDLAVALREIKRKLKDLGFPKCTCHQTLMLCVCRNIMEKKLLEKAVQKECKHRGMENCAEHLVLTDTSESEIEFEFDVSPPAALAKPPYPFKRKTFSNSTQTNPKDLKVPSKYPIQLGPYWRAYDCAAGDRYAGTAFGAPGEPVFEDGIFGYGGGGPHGLSACPGGREKPTGIWGGSPGGPMRGGGRGGPDGLGGLGGQSFPGAKRKPGGKSPLIPVRMPKRYIEAVKKAAQDAKDAIQNEIDRKKKGIDLIQYLRDKRALRKPWDPNNPGANAPLPVGPFIGPDGLTDAQRRRRELESMCIPPLDSMPRLGRGYDPCECYNPCGDQCCYPCCYCG